MHLCFYPPPPSLPFVLTCDSPAARLPVPASPTSIAWKSSTSKTDSAVIPAGDVGAAHWCVFGKMAYLRLTTKTGAQHRFDGFSKDDFAGLATTLREHFNVNLTKKSISSSGASWGKNSIENQRLTFYENIVQEDDVTTSNEGDELCGVDLKEVSQCVMPGNTRNEIELQFHEIDTLEANSDQLVQIRFWVAPDADGDPVDKDQATNAELLQKEIMDTAAIQNATGDIIAEFDETKGTFLTPRGRYNIELYGDFMRLHGNKYDYKIQYSDISKLFLLNKPDDMHCFFVIALEKPIRQGQQRYQYLVMQTSKDQAEVDINLTDTQLKEKYNDELTKTMTGSLSNVVAKVFKIVTGKKVFVPGKYSSLRQTQCVSCSLKANEGFLYPLEKQFIWLHKPPVLVRYDEIESVEFQRYGAGNAGGSTRNFDLAINLKSGAAKAQSVKEYVFSGIDKAEYTALQEYVTSKKIRIRNLKSAEAAGANYNEGSSDDEGGARIGGYGGDDDSEDDGDYDEAAAAKDDANESSGGDSDDSGMDSDGSDVQAVRGSSTKRKTPTKKRAPAKKGGKKKKKKDPNAPKRPTTSYLLYSNYVRPTIKAEHPDMAFGDMAKHISGLWKELDADGKAEFEASAATDKERYEKEMESYNPPSSDSDSSDSDSSDSDSDDSNKKSKKKSPKKKAKAAPKDPNAPKGAKGSYMYFTAAQRETIKTENPDLSFGDLSKKLGETWKGMDAEARTVYEEQAAEDKLRFKKETEEYNSMKAEALAMSDSSDDEAGGGAAAAMDSDSD